jgi:putative colanic acid biosynthesis acetyltransferase WcaF
MRSSNDHQTNRVSAHSRANQLVRLLWNVAYPLLFRPTPRFLNSWRVFLLRAFGAQLHQTAVVHASVKIWAPWNLRMDRGACLAPQVDCYNCAPIRIGAWAVISQYSYLCAGTHDHTSLDLPFIAGPISIGDQAWVCADVFVGPGVNVGDGAIVGARSSVYRNVPPWTIVAGNPAAFIRKRILAGGERCQPAS